MSLFRDYQFLKINLSKKHQGKWCLIYIKSKKTLPRSMFFNLFIKRYDFPDLEALSYLTSCRFFPNCWRISLNYIPDKTNSLMLYPVTKNYNTSIDSIITIEILPLNRLIASIILTIINPFSLIKILFQSPFHLIKKVKLVLLQNQQTMAPCISYKNWCNFYDLWSEEKIKSLFQSPYYKNWPNLFSFFNSKNKNKPNNLKIHPLQTWSTYSLNISKTNQSYYVLISHHETLRPHSLAVFADQAARHHYPAAIYADSDEIDQKHQRFNPIFKQKFNLPVLLTGLLTQDVWIIRQDIFEAFQKQTSELYQSITALRLALGLYLWEHHLYIHHISFILSHRISKITQEEQSELNNVIQSFKIKHRWQFNVHHQFPFRIAFNDYQSPVSIVIPTTVRSVIIQKCLLNLIKNTNFPSHEIILVISQNNPLNHLQNKILRSLLVFKNIRVIFYKTDEFNFAKSCNYAIKKTKYPFIALVNDDIEPLNSTWLFSMMGHMKNENIGVVGAKLFYPNGLIQHAGIIMGAANLCEHAGRFQQSNQFYLTHDHEISAVTGACMLIRRSAFDQVNGFDEKFEIAYNDIDFCLRLSHKGYHIIQCQQAHLIHYESLSLGNHYTGKRAGKERQEILALRNKYHHICNNDPFYSPNYALQRGMDYQLAFPPRISIPFGLTEK